MEAISNAGAAIGMLCKDGVVLVAEKKITSKLLDTHAVGVRREKMYKLDDHVCCAVAGITGVYGVLADAIQTSTMQLPFATVRAHIATAAAWARESLHSVHARS